MRAYAVDFADASITHAVRRLFCGTSYRSIREICYVQPAPRHSTRMHPKDVLFTGSPVARFAECSERYAISRLLRGTIYGTIRKNYHFCPLLWSSIRKVPKDMPSLRLSAVEHTEVSVKTTVNGTLCGIVYGTIRKLCRITPSQRHSLRKNPKDMLLSGHGTAPFTDASERTATVAPVYGQTYGTIREICHLPTAQRHCSRSLPKERPPVDPPAARLTDASAKTTARRRASADPRAGARCRRES